MSATARGIRIAQYCGYPRTSSSRRLRVGYARDVPLSGLCLYTNTEEPVGELLRVSVRDLSGHTAYDTLARVVFCDTRDDGWFEIGLDLVAAHEPCPVWGEREEAVSA